MKDGSRVRADEAYIRESILYPQAKIVAGYDDIMPTFKGLVTEDGLLKVIEYVKSMASKNGTESSATPAPTETSATATATATTAASQPGTPRQGRTNPQAGSVPGAR